VLIEELKRRNYDPDPVRQWKLAQDKDAVLEQDAEQNGEEDADDDMSAVVEVKAADYDYLLDMPMRSLTYERKEDLLKKKEAKMNEYEILRRKTCADLWREDLDLFLSVLQEVEDSEIEEKPKKAVKMPMLKQKKKQLVAEVLPSPKGCIALGLGQIFLSYSNVLLDLMCLLKSIDGFPLCVLMSVGYFLDDIESIFYLYSSILY